MNDNNNDHNGKNNKDVYKGAVAKHKRLTGLKTGTLSKKTKVAMTKIHEK